MIEEYHFGFIAIDGKNYNHDVEVRSFGEEENEVLAWQRKESHIIDREDVERAIDQKPDTIVIGTGESGMAKVSEEAKEEIENKGIKLIIDVTEQAIKTFNIISRESVEEEGEEEKVIGLFHLTC